jgi:hypothetical protein
MYRKGSHRVPHGSWSPREIIGLVLALCLLMVLVPVGARAAGSLMTIVDSTTTNQARVQNGALRVSDLPVGATPWWGRVATGTSVVLYSAAATGKKNLMLGSLTFTGPANVGAKFYATFAPDCGLPELDAIILQTATLKAGETKHFDFPQPLPIVRQDTKWCIIVSDNAPDADPDWQAKAVGYYY